MQGAAIATVIANGVTVIASIAILYWREHLIRARYLSFNKILDSWRRVLHVGVPATASNLLGPMTIAVITSFVASYGVAAVAGFGVAARIESLVMIIIFAVTSSVGPFTGQNFGAGRLDRIRSITGIADGFCVVYGIFGAIVLWLLARPLVSFFDSNTDVIETASLYLAIVPISLGGFGVMLVAVSSFNALGRPLPATLLTFIKLFLAYIPLAWFLSSIAGIAGIFWANAIAHVAFGLVGFVWLRRMLKSLQDDQLREAQTESTDSILR